MSEPAPFPPVTRASKEGLLAVGGDLGGARLLAAYRGGIFPWFGPGEPIMWWAPDPRMVLFPRNIHISRSLHKLLRKKLLPVTVNRDFPSVIAACAAPRRKNSGDGGTWITPAMQRAYQRLHRRGFAHSVEVWRDGVLAGGLYGVAIGRAFFGESMFSSGGGESKVALVHLARQLAAWDFAFIDCQLPSAHLAGMGAREIAREEFMRRLALAVRRPAAAWPKPSPGESSTET